MQNDMSRGLALSGPVPPAARPRPSRVLPVGAIDLPEGNSAANVGRSARRHRGEAREDVAASELVGSAQDGRVVVAPREAAYGAPERDGHPGR